MNRTILFYMELAKQSVPSNKTVREETIQDIKDLKSKSNLTQAKRGKELVAMMPAVENFSNLLGDDITKSIYWIFFEKIKWMNLKTDENWLEETKIERMEIKIDKELSILPKDWKTPYPNHFFQNSRAIWGIQKQCYKKVSWKKQWKKSKKSLRN